VRYGYQKQVDSKTGKPWPCRKN